MKPEEAKAILEEMETIDDTIYQYDPVYWEALKTAISALEKQVPKEPVEGYMFSSAFRELLMKKDPNMANRKGSCCPNCGEHVGESEQTLKKKNYHDYCKWCGQALKQPEGEE